MIRVAVKRRARLLTLTLVGAVLVGGAGVVRHRHATRAPSTAMPVGGANLATPVLAANELTVRSLAAHLRLNPRDRAARYRLAHLYFQRFDHTRSLGELRILEQQDPRDPGVPLRRAVILKSDGRADAAEKAIRRALALQPGNEQAVLLLGDVQLDRRQYRKALEVFERHLQAQPYSVAALLGKSRALERLYLTQERVKVDEMLAPVEKAAQLAPNNPRALAMLAKMKFAYLITPEDTAEAEVAALHAVQLDPQDPQPCVTLAQIYLSRPPTADNIGKVAEYAGRAGALNRNDPRSPYLIGRVALHRNEPDRATKALEHSLQLGPMPETVTHLAAAYRRSGNTERASHYAGIYQRYMDFVARRDALKAVRERQPKEARHYYQLAKLYLEAGEPEKAEQWLAQVPHVRFRGPVRDQLLAQARDLRKKGQNAPLLRLH